MATNDLESERHRLMQAIGRILESGASRHDDAYGALFVSNPLPMWVYDVDSLEILDANDAAQAKYGYSREEFVCLTLADIRPAEDMPKFLELTRQLPHFDRSGPWRHRKKDGSVTQVLINSHSIRFGPHNARLVILEDPDEAPL